MPFNLLEAGPMLAFNQPDGRNVLLLATAENLGVLVNRPLNAFAFGRLLRLADLAQTERMDTNAVIEKIRQLQISETRLWRKILPAIDIPEGLKVRIKQQNEVSDSLKHYWKNFGSYENFRQVCKSTFWPRVQGVFDFLASHEEGDAQLADWLDSHPVCLEEALEAVGSLYVEEAVRLMNQVRYAVNGADVDWSKPGTLSQKAIRALRSTDGVSVVLVGMRQVGYVEDVLSELRRSVAKKDRQSSWETLRQAITDMFPASK